MAGKKLSPKNFWFGSQSFLWQTELQTRCSSHPHAALPNSQLLNPAQHHPSPRTVTGSQWRTGGTRHPQPLCCSWKGKAERLICSFFLPAELISAGQGLGNAVILDVPSNSSEVPSKPSPTLSPSPQKIRHDIPVLKEKPPPPLCPTAHREGNRNGRGSVASDQWSKRPCEINKESLTHPTPNFSSFIHGNGSSPKRWAAQASFPCSAGGPGIGSQTLPSPEHPPPMPQ